MPASSHTTRSQEQPIPYLPAQVAIEPLAMTSSPADKVPIQAVVRAFSVLEVLAAAPAGIRLGDLSRTVGLHKATVYRLVRTLVLIGYVTQTADGEPYRVSRQLVRPKSHPTSGPAKLDPLRRLAGRLTNFIPAKRGGAGKSREPRAAIVQLARREKAEAREHGG
jgi:hypothetical protein